MQVRFYTSSSGRKPVEEFVQSLSDGMREQLYEALRLLESGERLAMPLSRSLSGIKEGLHELRLTDESGTYRVFYYIKLRDAIYVVHGFKKKTQKTPSKELAIALNRIRRL